MTIYEFEAYGETKRESEEIFPAALSALGQSEGHGAELAFDQNDETWWEDEGTSGTWLEASFGKQRAVTGVWVSTPGQVGAFSVQAEKNGAWETVADCPAGSYSGPIDMALCITDKIRIVFDEGPAALSEVHIFAQTWLENGTGLSKEGWFSMPFSAQDESVAGNFLYLVGGYTSFGVGCTWWGSIKENETQFVGDQIGELVIDYMDQTQTRIPLIIGYNIWFKELFINGMEPFLTGAAQEAETVSALKSALHLSGAWEQTDDPVLKIRVPNKAVKAITIADDPIKPGAPLIKGGYLVEQDSANSLNGEIPITVDHSFFETHTIDAQNPYPAPVQENIKKVCRRIMTYEEDFENVEPYEIPAGYNKTRVEFSGTSLANIATGIFYENVADMAGKITESGMMMESTIGAPNWFYNGWGAWMNANPGTGTYSAYMFSRNHKGATALSSLGYLAEAQSVVGYDHQQLMYFPNNNLSIKGKPVPGHWTMLVNDPMHYMNNPGAGTNYTYKRFGEDYKNIGGVETDGHGLTMMFIYNIWKNSGASPQWVTENWDYISEAVDYIQWCLDNPDVSFCENGLLYAESEATMMGFSMYCNIPCYLGVRMYAEMAEAAGKTEEAARWTKLADGLEEAILTHFSTGEKWNLAKAGYYHDSAMPLYADYLGLDAKNKAPQEWVSRSENTYEEDRNAYIGDLYIGPRGFGYDHNFMTQTALLLDKTSEYNQFIERLVKLCYSPRLPKPYIVPESMSYDVRTGAYRRQGDLGNLAQQGETVKTMLMWTGVSDETDGTITIMPRLPQNWNVKVSEMQVPRGQSVVSFSAGYPQENRQTASITLNSGPAASLRFRFGPFSPEAKTAAATINGASCAAELVPSGDSKWVWVTVENLAPGQTCALSASVKQAAVPTLEKPPVPTATATKTTITVQNPSGLCEYSLDQKTWNSDGVFENLTPDTGYTLWCRFKNPTAQQDGAPVAVFVKTKGQSAVSGPRAAAVRTTDVKTQAVSRPFGTSRMVEQNGRQMVLYEIDEEKALVADGAVSAVLEETAQTVQISLAGTTVQKLSEQNKSILAGSAGCYVELAASDISLAEGAAALGKKPEEISVLICIDVREEQKAAFSLAFTDGKREAEQEAFSAPARLCILAVWGEGAYTAAFLENGKARPVPTLFSGGTATAVIRQPGTYFITGGDGAFSDIGGHWAANDVSDLARRLVVNGYGGKKFMPDKAVSRGEFAAAAYRALALPSAGDAGFADVKPAMWYAEAVGAAFDAGIVAGTGENTFSPDEALKRQEAMAMLAVRPKAWALPPRKAKSNHKAFATGKPFPPGPGRTRRFVRRRALWKATGAICCPRSRLPAPKWRPCGAACCKRPGYINEL